VARGIIMHYYMGPAPIIIALRRDDSQEALMHFNTADHGLSSSSSDQSAKMHLDEEIKAVY
jgi:hypothetical protein